jgi:hypothetical protein
MAAAAQGVGKSLTQRAWQDVEGAYTEIRDLGRHSPPIVSASRFHGLHNQAPKTLQKGRGTGILCHIALDVSLPSCSAKASGVRFGRCFYCRRFDLQLCEPSSSTIERTVLLRSLPSHPLQISFFLPPVLPFLLLSRVLPFLCFKTGPSFCLAQINVPPCLISHDVILTAL